MDIKDIAEKLPLPAGIDKIEGTVLGVSEKIGYFRGFRKGLGIGLGIGAAALLVFVVAPKVMKLVTEQKAAADPELVQAEDGE